MTGGCYLHNDSCLRTTFQKLLWKKEPTRGTALVQRKPLPTIVSNSATFNI